MPLPSSFFDWALIQRLTGRAAPSDDQIVDEWTASDPDHAQLLERIEQGWAHLDTEPATRDETWRVSAWGRLAVRMQTSMRETEDEATRAFSARGIDNLRVSAREKRADGGAARGVGGRTLRRWVWPTGIAILIALVPVFLGHHLRRDLGTTRTYTTAIGQRATLLLDDGTRVMMAPQTTLRLVRFGRRARTLVLDGDAYFDVVQSARAPFVIQAGTSTTRVLGTAFEVRHYRDEKEVRVAVATGKVLVSAGAARSAVAVTAGHVLSLTDSTQTVKGVDNIDTEIGWLGDQLVFQDAPMSKVLATLTRWYGYAFRYTDSAVVQQNVTIGLSMRSSTEALATLEQILDVSLTVVGDTVTLTPVHGRAMPSRRAKHYDVWVPTREVGR